MKIRTTLSNVLREAGIGIGLICLIIVFMIVAPYFGTPDNFRNIMTQVTINIIISVGMTFVILIGGIDLSVGSVLALCGVLAGTIITNKSFPTWEAILLSILASLGIGIFCGFLNGWITERWKIPPFITTLGMMNIARGAALQLTQARVIYNFPKSFDNFGSIQILNLIPLIFIIALTLVIFGSFILKSTVFGRFVFTIGNNEEAVRLSGHNTSIYRIITFMICGLMVGIAAILYNARLTIADSAIGSGFELNAIAAVIIGGTSFSGGKGSMLGTFLGACLMGVLNNGLLLLGVSDFVRQMFTGLVIVIAVIMDTYRAKASLATQ
jgi:ribose transport system permease protein